MRLLESEADPVQLLRVRHDRLLVLHPSESDGALPQPVAFSAGVLQPALHIPTEAGDEVVRALGGTYEVRLEPVVVAVEAVTGRDSETQSLIQPPGEPDALEQVSAEAVDVPEHENPPDAPRVLLRVGEEPRELIAPLDRLPALGAVRVDPIRPGRGQPEALADALDLRDLLLDAPVILLVAAVPAVRPGFDGSPVHFPEILHGDTFCPFACFALEGFAVARYAVSASLMMSDFDLRRVHFASSS